MQFRKTYLKVLILTGAGACLWGCASDRYAAKTKSIEGSQTVTEVITPKGGGLNEFAIDPTAMLAEHNKWRENVGQAPLTWSDALARAAKDWAFQQKQRGCAMQHSPSPRRYGENIYKASPVRWTSGKTEVQSVAVHQVVDRWAIERKDYDYTSNTCTSVCGHYTQIIWWETQQVGCGKVLCADKSQIWVCSYHPKGNYLGERPY